MSKIVIGKVEGKNVGFDTDLLLATRLLITADSGGGKSWLARVLFEQTFGKIQQIIIDPEGEFASLREKFPFVLAGKGGDTPVDIRSAGMLAHRLLKLRVSAICDLYELKPDQRHIWVRDFFTALIEAPKDLRVPLIVPVDEFHMFAPEKGQGESEALDASIDMATRGRKRGICLVGITQRLAMLSKSVTSQLQNRLVGAQFEEVNVKAAVKLFGIAPGAEERGFRKKIQLLEPGQFFAYGRAISRERILVKVGEVETTHPKAFEKHSVPLPPTPEKIKGLLPQLADLPQEAERKALTEAEYKRQIRELMQEKKTLERQIAAPQKASAAPPAKSGDTQELKALARTAKEFRSLLEEAMKISAKINAIGFDGVDVKPEEIAAAVEKAATEVGKIAAQKIAMKRRELEKLKEEVNRLLEKLNAKLGDDKFEIAVNVVKNEPTSITASPRLPRPARPAPESNGDLTNPQVKILSRLVELLECTNQPSVSKEQLAAWSEYSPNSGGYNNYLGSLRSVGMIEYPSGGMVTITDEGREHAQPGDVPVDNSEMLERAKRVLGGSEGKLLEILHDTRETVDKTQLAVAAGFSPNSGGFNNYLGHMRTLGFIDYPSPGKVRCSDWMYVA